MTDIKQEFQFHFDQMQKSVGKCQQDKYGLWNSIIVFNSIIVSSFAIILAINPDNKLSPQLVFIFFFIVFFPIVLSSINYLFSHVSHKKELDIAVENISSFFADRFNELYKSQGTEKINKIAEKKTTDDTKQGTKQKVNFINTGKLQKYIKWSERISMTFSLFVLLFFFYILFEINYNSGTR